MSDCVSGDFSGSEDSNNVKSLTSSVTDLLTDRKYSHVCVMTYWTKKNVVLGVDLSYIGQDCFAIPSILGKIYDLETLLKQLSRCYPELTYLSLLGNPACPDQLSNLEKDEEDYQRYRYYILHQIPNLKFLDSTPVKAFEKSEAKRIGSYMKVARPKVDIAQEASDEIADSRYSPLPPNMKREGTHRGSFGRLRQRYTGTQSEGNRFIRDNEL